MKNEAPSEPMVWAVSVLASYRLVRLAIEDTLFDDARNKLYPKLARGGAVGQWFLALITCPWCLGVWVAFLITVASRRDRSFVYRFLWWMSVAAAQPFVHMVEGLIHESTVTATAVGDVARSATDFLDEDKDAAA